MKFFLLLTTAAALCAQEQPKPKTLLPQTTIQSIVDEVSGTLALQHILDLAGYEHDRLEQEYKTTYHEAAFIEKMGSSTAWKTSTSSASSCPTRRGMAKWANCGWSSRRSASCSATAILPPCHRE